MPPKSLKAIATNLSGGFIVATGPSYLVCFFDSALDVAANGEGLVLRARLPARAGVRYLAAIVAMTVRSTPTLLSLSPGHRATKSSSLPSPVPDLDPPGDAHERGPAVELEPHLRVEVVEHWQHQVVADQAWIANAEPLRALHATEDVLCEGGS